MRIDSHHSSSERYPLDHLGTILERNRFEGSVFVGPPCWPSNEFVKAAVVQTDDLNPPQLDGYQRYPKFRGICYQPAADEVPEVFAELEQRSLSLDLLAGLSLVSRIAERFPSLRIAIDHLGAPISAAWGRQIEEAARHPNVYCKISGLWRLATSPLPYVRHAIELFGPSRLMFGSDWPNGLPEHSWKAALAAFTQAIGARSIEFREELLGGTAARFYSL